MKKLKVLIVDSDPNFRKQLAFALEKTWEVLEAADRSTAIHFLSPERRPDIVLMDLHLPPRPNVIEEGLCVLATFKKKVPHVPVIVVTAEEGEESFIRTRKLKVDGYVTKPFLLQDLKAVMRHALNRPEKDRRVSPRVRCAFPVKYTRVSEEAAYTRETMTVDISSSGMMFVLKDPPDIFEDYINLELSLPPDYSWIPVKGEKKWACKLEEEGDYYMGVRFSSIARNHLTRLRKTIYPH